MVMLKNNYQTMEHLLIKKMEAFYQKCGINMQKIPQFNTSSNPAQTFMKQLGKTYENGS